MSEDEDMDSNGELRAHRARPLSALYTEVKRLDEVAILRDKLADAESKRVNGLFAAQETAVHAALVAQEKAVAAALAASEKAVNKAEASQQRTNEGQNEFRQQLKDQAGTFMPRSESESIARELRGLIAETHKELGNVRSRLDLGPPSLPILQARSDINDGRRLGALDTRNLAFLILGALLAIAGFVLKGG